MPLWPTLHLHQYSRNYCNHHAIARGLAELVWPTFQINLEANKRADFKRWVCTCQRSRQIQQYLCGFAGNRWFNNVVLFTEKIAPPSGFSGFSVCKPAPPRRRNPMSSVCFLSSYSNKLVVQSSLFQIEGKQQHALKTGSDAGRRQKNRRGR